jgi:two-component system phosphate regulon sensor histidine kinase PhoR
MRALVRTIPRRAALAALAGLLAGVALLAIVAPSLADRHDAETLRAWLGSEARFAGDLARDGLRARDPNVLDPLAHRIGQSAGVRVTFIDPTGVVLGESDEDRLTMENHASRPEVAAALAGTEGSTTRFSATVQRDLLYVAVPVRDGGPILGVARTALPVTTLESFASRLGGTIALAGALATAVALAVVVLLSRAVTGPIGALTRSAERVAGGGSARFEAGGPDETRRLGEALRTMSDRITGERHHAETERDRLAVLIDELGDAIVIATADGVIERVNRAATELFGAPLPGKRLMDVVRDHEVIDVITGARQDRDSVAHVERTEPPRFQRVVARRLEDGELLLVIQDLTNLRRLQTVRRDFVANVSHELRTPLASLKAMAETLEAGGELRRGRRA